MENSLTARADGPRKSEFPMGAYVIYEMRDGRRMRGQVVGPDQNYFPSPQSVFVFFSATGFTQLLDVKDLEPDTAAVPHP